MAALDLVNPTIARGEPGARLGLLAQRLVGVLSITVRRRRHKEARHE
jgi:hypothetical protein